MKLDKLLLLLILGSVLPACGQKTFDQKMESLYKNTVPLISAEELKQLQYTDVFILDTREQEEFEVSHIEGAQFVSFDDFEAEDVGNIPKNAQVVVYCSVGYRSEQIGEKLQEMGYRHVKNLYGGIFEWKNQGNEVYNTNNQPTDSVHTYNWNWSKWLYKGIKVYE
mgnify:CR=1 FL=1